MEQIRRFYRGDFTLKLSFYTEQDGTSIMQPVPQHVRVTYFTDKCWDAYIVERDGDKTTNCKVSDDGNSLIVFMSLSKQDIGIGELKYVISEYVTDSTYPEGCRVVSTPGSTDVLLWRGVDSDSETIIEHELINVKSITPITYPALCELRDSGGLEAGAFYRITDYVTTTSQANTQSAGHQFDIIVQALDNHTLSEEAHAIHHDGDTYFADSNLAAWRLRYSLDNDTNRFAWAVADIAERAQSWKTSWGVLESKLNTEASTNYTTAIVDGVTKYLYAPAERGTFLDSKTFYRVTGSTVVSSYSELTFESDNRPSTEEYEDEDGNIVEDTYWGDVTEIRVKTSDGTLVTTLYNDGGSSFYDEDDYNNMMEYPISFDEATTYDEENGVYILNPESGMDEWWNDYRGGEITIDAKEYYNGSVAALYYAVDQVLPQSSSQPTIQIYSAETGYIYQSDDWSDRVSWLSYIAPEVNGKGVIYRMIDEHDNDAFYDFKNIQMKINDVWYYTFSVDDNEDGSITEATADYTIRAANKQIANYVYRNTILAGNVDMKTLTLPFNVLKASVDCSSRCSDNLLEAYCKNIVLGQWCFSNKFGAVCQKIQLGDKTRGFVFGQTCSNISLRTGATDTSDLLPSSTYCQFATGTRNVTLWTGSTVSSSKSLTLLNINARMSNMTYIEISALGQTYPINVCSNSSSVIKVWNDADLVE